VAVGARRLRDAHARTAGFLSTFKYLITLLQEKLYKKRDFFLYRYQLLQPSRCSPALGIEGLLNENILLDKNGPVASCYSIRYGTTGVMDPHRFNGSRSNFFISMQIRIRIQGAKPMRIRILVIL
jgi:hypothetical protein